MIFLFKFLYRKLKGYRLLVLLAILITVLQVGSDLLGAMPLKFIPSKINNPGSDPACTFPFLDGVLSAFDQPFFDPSLIPSQPGQIKLPPLSPCPATGNPSAIAHPVYYHHSVIGVIIFSVLMLVVFGLLSALFTYIELYLAAYIAQHLSGRLRSQLFEHLQRLSLDWHGKQKTGDLVQRITGNIADIEKLVTDGMVDMLAGILTLLGVIIIMLVISTQYTLISLCVAPLLFLIVLSYTKSIKAATKKQAKAAGEVAMVATEDINALQVIRAFTLEKREDKRFQRYVGKQRQAGLQAGRLQAQFTPLVAILLLIGTAIIIGVGGYVSAGNPFNGGFFSIAASSIDVGTLILFMTYLKMLYQPMRNISKLTNLANLASSGAERIQTVFDQAPEITDTALPYEGSEKLRGDVTFDAVHFGYVKDTPILKDIHLHIPAGKRIALVGLSGGGKTTMVKLIPRFYEIESGALKLDNKDIREYPLAVVRQNISMVLQESVLFEGTFRDNIQVGRSDATLDDIIEAAKKAQIHETILEKGGYDAEVYEQGKNLSLGQRQRIAIARAILRDAPILILDEPTASLDVEAEGQVMRALDQLIVGRTVIMISHRLSTLGHVDEIVVVKGGAIIEQGTYKELKRQGGVFAMLLEEQNRYNIERLGEESTILRSAFMPPLSEEKTQPLVEQPSVALPVPELVAVGAGATNSANTHNSSLNNGHRETHTIYQPPLTDTPASPDTISTLILPHLNIASEDEDPTLRLPRTNSDAASLAPRVLVELDGEIIGERTLNTPVLWIGRLLKSDIHISDRRISQKHARIVEQGDSWTIENIDSFNGLIYQGKRIEQHTFSNGDKVYLAPTIALYYRVGE